ncbi:Inactive dipeptidyl peptidase 10 [Liparis tanakae]|uniref:Inactive dipeptidyl peptidase 10 n=1 Tax=Liparis tanakae TaxID=230148 RepID=A0A4Z2GL87_9TELE|nr:Inactive dipeptidyl peptidase 10 [Liparis tanakae]
MALPCNRDAFEHAADKQRDLAEALFRNARLPDLGPIGPERNWKGIGISLLVIVAVLSLIGLSIVLLSKDDGGKPFGSQLTLDDLFQRNFQIYDPDAKWMSAYRQFPPTSLPLSFGTAEARPKEYRQLAPVTSPVPVRWNMESMFIPFQSRNLEFG